MRWDLYCRVVDNFGDIGVAWRLAADLAGRGEAVRLFADDASALAWLAPGGAHGVDVRPWARAAASDADVVVELFGAGLPEAVASGIAAAPEQPLCINLEHLTAEPYAARSHRLPSPRAAGGGRVTTTWFFFPGFEAGTGGLLREPGLREARAAFGDDGAAWLAAHGIEARPGERRVSVFSYANDAFADLVDALAPEPTLLLPTPGHATAAATAVLGPALARGRLRAVPLPFFDQAGFDRLLWSCDFNLVRGEDSLVRAVWAGVPFLWQLYPQDDGAHHAKLEAFLTTALRGAAPALAGGIGAAFRQWNGMAGADGLVAALAPSPFAAWRHHAEAWRDRLASQADLGSQLLDFARAGR